MKNKQRWVAILAGVMAAIMLLGLIAGIMPVHAETSAQIKDRINDLKDEKAEVDAEIEALEGQISDNRDDMSAVVNQKNVIDQEIFLINRQISLINDQILEYGLLIADKQDELDAKEAHLAELQAKNRERIRAMEKNGKVSYWSVIFKANSFVDLLDRLRMIEEIARADQQRLEDMAQAAQEVSVAKESLETEKLALEASKDELAAAQIVLDGKRAEADALLQELVALGAEYEALLDESEAEQAELMAQIAKAEKEYNAQKAKEQAALRPSTPSGGNPPPVSGGWQVPCNYWVLTSPFGGRIHPIYGDYRMHYGVDLAGATGTPIYATRSGTVTAASYNGSAGYYVSINHGDGYSSIYMHMTHYVVSYGQHVNQGQIIGYMGSTGGSTGPHLHFGISYNGVYVNPANYMPL